MDTAGFWREFEAWYVRSLRAFQQEPTAVSLAGGAARRGRRRRRDWNWHNVIGLWCALPLFVVVLSGVFISYPELLQLAEKGVAEKTSGTGAPSPLPSRAPQSTAPDLDALWVIAEQMAPGWQAITMRFSPPGSPALNFSITTGEGVRPTHWSRLTLDKKTGARIRWQRYDAHGAIRKAMAWGRWLHTGEAGGLAGQTLAALASAGAVLLMWTGTRSERVPAWLSRRHRQRLCLTEGGGANRVGGAFEDPLCPLLWRPLIVSQSFHLRARERRCRPCSRRLHSSVRSLVLW